MKTESPSTSTVLTLIGIVIAIIGLLFGDNLYTQRTGHSIFTKATLTPPAETPITQWQLGALIYEETFEDDITKDLSVVFGNFDIVREPDGNHVWRTVNGGFSQVPLSPGTDDYAIQVRIRQLSGDQGFGIVHTRQQKGSICPSYQVYMDASGASLNLVEKSPSCEELRLTGLFQAYHLILKNGVWYTARVEAKGSEVRVYWDGQLVLRDRDIDGNVLHDNGVGFSSCCGELLPNTFEFDDIRVWAINP